MASPDKRSLDALKKMGSGRKAPGEVAILYRQALQQFGVQFLWHRQPSAEPTITQALAISDCLRSEGSTAARALAVKIEEACRAAP